MILRELGIYGWSESHENLVLASILTGDPLLLIGSHGTAKTHLARVIAKALGKKFLSYDASKALFEDVLGYPDIEKLKKGIVSYLPSKVTIWDKEFILIDELNRALPEMQSKWLEVIRSRKIMGFKTSVKWVWAAMNPISYSGAQVLDEALVGRFALFIYPPEALEMEEEDRIKVAKLITEDDAPALDEWKGKKDNAIQGSNLKEIGEKMEKILEAGATYFERLKKEMGTLAQFLAKFSDLLSKETKGKIRLDGRRLGFIYRNLLAIRAIELAKAEVLGMKLPNFLDSAKSTIEASIPTGINDESVNKEEEYHKLEICFDLLSSYFEEGSELEKVNLIYELFTTTDLMRKAELLLKLDLGELAKTKAWNDLVNNGKDITTLAYVALQLEAKRKGTIPQEMLEPLSKGINSWRLSSSSLPNLKGESIEYVEEVENLIQTKTDLHLVVSLERTKELLKEERISSENIRKARQRIEKDLKVFENFLKE